MKYYRYILFCLFFFSLGLFAQNKEREPGKCLPLITPKDGKYFLCPGEKLVYNFHYKWGIINSDVARGYISTDIVKINGKSAYKFSISGKTLKFYRMFFKVNEDFISWMDVTTLQPIRYSRNTIEGGYYAIDRYIYNFKDKMGIYASLDDELEGKRDLVLPLNKCTFDFITMLAHLRNVDMSRIKKDYDYIVSFALSGQVDKIKIQYKGKEKINIPGIGYLNTLKFCFRMMGGEQFKDNTKMYIWLSDDENRIPVSFRTPIKVGTVHGNLLSYSGLEEPLKAVEK